MFANLVVDMAELSVPHTQATLRWMRNVTFPAIRDQPTDVRLVVHVRTKFLWQTNMVRKVLSAMVKAMNVSLMVTQKFKPANQTGPTGINATWRLQGLVRKSGCAYVSQTTIKPTDIIAAGYFRAIKGQFVPMLKRADYLGGLFVVRNCAVNKGIINGYCLYITKKHHSPDHVPHAGCAAGQTVVLRRKVWQKIGFPVSRHHTKLLNFMRTIVVRKFLGNKTWAPKAQLQRAAVGEPDTRFQLLEELDLTDSRFTIADVLEVSSKMQPAILTLQTPLSRTYNAVFWKKHQADIMHPSRRALCNKQQNRQIQNRFPSVNLSIVHQLLRAKPYIFNVTIEDMCKNRQNKTCAMEDLERTRSLMKRKSKSKELTPVGALPHPPAASASGDTAMDEAAVRLAAAVSAQQQAKANLHTAQAASAAARLWPNASIMIPSPLQV